MRFFFGFVCGVLALFIAGYAFVAGGGMPVATQAKPLPFEKFIARTSIRAALKKQATQTAPFVLDASHLLAGAKIYRENCSGCHGAIEQKDTHFQAAMFPHPPLLLPPKKGVTDDPVGATYWIAKNGIRMTGMPGFADLLNDTELWEVSMLLANADKLPQDVQALLK